MKERVPERLCGACGRPRSAVARVGCGCIPEWVWELPKMKEAVAKQDATTVIRLVRWNTDLSHLALVKMTGLAQSTISDVVSGKLVLKKVDKITAALEASEQLPPPTHPNHRELTQQY